MSKKSHLERSVGSVGGVGGVLILFSIAESDRQKKFARCYRHTRRHELLFITYYLLLPEPNKILVQQTNPTYNYL